MKIQRYLREEKGIPVSAAGAVEPVTVETDIGGEIGKLTDRYYQKKGVVELMQASSDLEDKVRGFEELPVGRQLKKKPHGANEFQGNRMTYTQAAEAWFDKTSSTGRENLPTWLLEDWDAEMSDRRDTFLDRASVRQQQYDAAEEESAFSNDLDSQVQEAYRNPLEVPRYFGYISRKIDELDRPDGELLKLNARDKIYLSAVNGLARTDPEEARAFLERLYTEGEKKDRLPGDIYDKGLADIARNEAAIKKAGEASKKAANDIELAEVAKYKLASQGLSIFQRHDLSEEIRLSGKLSDKNMSTLLAFIDRGPRLYGDGAVAGTIDNDLEGHDLRDVEDLHTKREITDFEYTRLKAYYDHIQTDPLYKDQCGIAAGLIDDETFGEIETSLDKAKAKNLKRQVDAGIAKAMAAGYEPEKARDKALVDVKIRHAKKPRKWLWDKPYTDEELLAARIDRMARYNIKESDVSLKSEKGAELRELIDADIVYDLYDYPEGLRKSYSPEENRIEVKVLLYLAKHGLSNTEENRMIAFKEITGVE